MTTMAHAALRWGVVGIALGGAVGVGTLARVAASGRSPIDQFTSTPAWIVCATAAIAAVFGLAVWNGLRGDPVLAHWLCGFAFTIAGYQLTSETAAWLHAEGRTASVLFLVVGVLAATGWMVVLGTAQAAATVIAGRALSDRTGRGVLVFIVAALAVVELFWFVFPSPIVAEMSAGPPPTLLPPEVLLHPTVDAIGGTVSFGWMASLLVAPAVFWWMAAHSRGLRRAVLARVGVGTVLPVLVVAVCGILAMGVAAGSDPVVELLGLTVGFCAAAVLSAWWLTAVLRDARSPEGRVLTALGRLTPALLWTLYMLLLIQVAGPVAEALGFGAARATVLAVAIGAATCVPWLLFVRWCTARVDPRRALAAAVIGGADDGEPVGRLAQRTLREALGDEDARLLVARDGGGWLDADLTATDDPRGATAPIRDRSGAVVGALESAGRFVDTARLTEIVRPLVERAALEAAVRDRTERLARERERADAAADEARRRIERDLHDGVQGRLVSLGLSLSLAKDHVDDPASRLLLEETVSGIGTAVAELRELSAGTVSSRLAEHGLADAVDGLVRRVPVPVDAVIEDVRLERPVEAVAYFVIAEAIANALKHAAAERISVSVRGDGTVVTVAVADDGVGGVDLRVGSGLRKLTERVHAVGGRLVVGDRDPRGTLLEAVLPCAP